MDLVSLLRSKGERFAAIGWSEGEGGWCRGSGVWFFYFLLLWAKKGERDSVLLQCGGCGRFGAVVWAGGGGMGTVLLLRHEGGGGEGGAAGTDLIIRDTMLCAAPLDTYCLGPSVAPGCFAAV